MKFIVEARHPLNALKRQLLKHKGHKLSIGMYGDNDSITIECNTCTKILIDIGDTQGDLSLILECS